MTRKKTKGIMIGLQEIHRTNVSFPNWSKTFYRRYTSENAARREVAEWNRLDNPYDKLRIVNIGRMSKKR